MQVSSDWRHPWCWAEFNWRYLCCQAEFVLCCAVVIADALLAVALAQVRAVVANVSRCSVSLATMLLTLGQSLGRWSPSQHQHDCLHNTTKEYYEAGNKGAMSGCGSLEHRLLL